MTPDTSAPAGPYGDQGPLAIIGMGCLFPQADNLEAYWANIMAGVDCVTDIPPTHWNPDEHYDPDPRARDKVYARRGGFLNPIRFSPLEFGVSPRDIEAIDTTQLLGLVAAKHALTDAGYGPDRDFDREHTSVILGVTGALEMVLPLSARLGHPIWRKALAEAGVDHVVAEDVVERIAGSYVEWQENSFPGLLGNVAAGRIANRLDLGGTNCVVDAACASSLSALHLSALELYCGRANMVVTGGFDTFNDVFMYACFSKTPAISPTGNSRPFDAGADGTILGEGLGVVVVKRLRDAERDGDRIYAVVRGLGSSSDGKGNAVYAPSVKGQVRAVGRALQSAAVGPETVELVEAHGTGTTVGDGIELESLFATYGRADRRRPWCALGSVKSQIGHTKAAAGSAGLIKAALALQRKILPPTIKIDTPLPPLNTPESPFYLNTKPRPWLPAKDHPRRAALSSFGFGGSNFHLVLEEYDREKQAVDWDGRVQIAALSAADREGVLEKLNQWPDHDDWTALRAWAAETRERFDPRDPCRLTLVIERGATDIPRLREACAKRLRQEEGGWSLPDGAWFGTGERPGKLALLFPGQGSQYTGMLRELACRFPQMLRVLAAADKAFDRQEGDASAQRLSEYIYPVGEYSDEDRRENEKRLRDTRVAQPAIGAVALGAYRVLEYFGLKGEMAAGHSYGELVALCASGRYGEPELHSLSRLRGSLMAGSNGHQGAMLAVKTGAEQAAEIMEANKLQDIVVANKNAPQQTVLSGEALGIDRAEAVFKGAGIRSVRLNVSNAFHSRLMDSAQKPFQDALGRVRFISSPMPVYANSTAEPYPEDEQGARDILAGQLVRPVEFILQIINMQNAGVGAFLEVGPGKSLTGLVNAILKDKQPHTLALDVSKGARSGLFDLGRALAHLAALGYSPDLKRWDEGFSEAEESTATGYSVYLSGANKFEPKPRPATPAPERQQIAAPGPVAPAKEVTPQDEPLGHMQRETKNALMSNRISGTDAPAAEKSALQEALRLTQENMRALQEMHARTADLHGRFLAGQDAAHQSMQDLIRQQKFILEKHLGKGAIPDTPGATAAEPKRAGEPAFVSEPAPLPVDEPRQAGPVETDAGELMDLLLEIVSETTGYPREMLNPDMNLDADLGIDSIKRVEILAALSERFPEASDVGTEELGGIETLADVAGLFAQSTPGSVASPAAGRGPAKHDVADMLLAVVAEQTGYPLDMLNLSMNLDADLGIDSIKRVEILSALSERLPHLPEVATDRLGDLQTLEEVVDYLGDHLGSQGEAPGAGADEVVRLLIDLVAQQTGYPPDMLDLDMNLDTDLGIDSIKRVEILSALSEMMPQLPTVETEQLGALATLRQVAEYLTAGPSTDPPAGSEEPEPDSAVWAAVCAAMDRLAGYPAETLKPSLRVEEDLGIDPVGMTELLQTVGEKLGINPGLIHFGGSDTLGTVAQYFMGLREDLPPEDGKAETPGPQNQSVDRYVVEVQSLERSSRRKLIESPESAEVWVAGGSADMAAGIADEFRFRRMNAVLIGREEFHNRPVPDGLAGLVLLAEGPEVDDDFITASFLLLKRTAAALRNRDNGRRALLAAVSFMDGRFGFSGRAGIRPLTGGPAGLAKTVQHEWPEVAVKVLDIDPQMAVPDDTARQIVDELLIEGPLEVGISGEEYRTLKLRRETLASSDAGMRLNPGDVVLISGGARGVTAEAALALARQWQPTLVLFGRTPAPGEEPDWSAGLTGETEIKKELVRRAPEGTTPKEIQCAFGRLVADREMRRNLSRLRDTGARVEYRSVDVADPEAVQRAVDQIRRDYGPVKGLVHGAGVLADRYIVDKTREQFQQVWTTKVNGLKNMLRSTGDDALKFMALFSSSTGRFGRSGQADYAAANEVLNKMAQVEAARRPDCRVAAFNWGPWDGGMVNASLRNLFQQEGLSVIPLEAGAEYMVRELASGGRGPVEIVVMGGGSRLPKELMAAEPPSGGGPMLVERTVSVERAPVLKDHVLDGQAVLPMVLMIEWMARAGCQGADGYRFFGLDGLKVHQRLTVAGGEPTSLNLLVDEDDRDSDVVVRRVSLNGMNGRDPVMYADCRVVLAREIESGQAEPANDRLGLYPNNDMIYQDGRLFHGPGMQGIVHIEGCGDRGISGRVKTSPPPEAWLPDERGASWLTDPLALDAVLQMVILWCWENHGLPALPVALGKYRQFVDAFPSNAEVRAEISVKEIKGSIIRANVELVDDEGRLLARLEDQDNIASKNLINAYLRNRLTGDTEEAMDSPGLPVYEHRPADQ